MPAAARVIFAACPRPRLSRLSTIVLGVTAHALERRQVAVDRRQDGLPEHAHLAHPERDLGARAIERARLTASQAAVPQREGATAHNSLVPQPPKSTVVAQQAVCDDEGRLRSGGAHRAAQEQQIMRLRRQLEDADATAAAEARQAGTRQAAAAEAAEQKAILTRVQDELRYMACLYGGGWPCVHPKYFNDEFDVRALFVACRCRCPAAGMATCALMNRSLTFVCFGA